MNKIVSLPSRKIELFRRRKIKSKKTVICTWEICICEVQGENLFGFLFGGFSFQSNLESYLWPKLHNLNRYSFQNVVCGYASSSECECIKSNTKLSWEPWTSKLHSPLNCEPLTSKKFQGLFQGNCGGIARKEVRFLLRWSPKCLSSAPLCHIYPISFRNDDIYFLIWISVTGFCRVNECIFKKFLSLCLICFPWDV